MLAGVRREWDDWNASFAWYTSLLGSDVQARAFDHRGGPSAVRRATRATAAFTLVLGLYLASFLPGGPPGDPLAPAVALVAVLALPFALRRAPPRVAAMTVSIEPHHSRECGLDNVYLANVKASRCAECNEKAVQIPAIARLKAKLTPEALMAGGAKIPAPIQMQVPPDHEKAPDWQVRLWHPEGAQVFTISAAGIAQKPR